MKQFIILIACLMCVSCVTTKPTCDPIQKFCYESKYSPREIVGWNEMKDKLWSLSNTRLAFVFKHPSKLIYAVVAVEYPNSIMNYAILENGKVSFFRLNQESNTYKARPLDKSEEKSFKAFFKRIMEPKGLNV